MLDIKILRENPERVRDTLDKRHATADLDAILRADEKRRKLVYEMEQLRAEQNTASQEIGKRKKAGEYALHAIEAMKNIKEKIAAFEEEVRGADEELRGALLTLPNLLDDSLPVGKDEGANRLERQWGAPPEFDFEAQDHVALGEVLGILDFERASKLTGARFCLLKGAGARLERALISLMLDIHTRDHGYAEVLPPYMVNSESMRGTGQLPKFAEDSFRVAETDFWLIPTAEVPLTNIHRGEILDAAQLPIKYAACTPCFRSEAGSHGKDTRGMIRQHQFNKVEMVKFTKPEDSRDELESLTRDAERILQILELPYQVVTLSTGDVGFSAAKTYDIEVWLPGQDRYREISSCSNCTDFQARRANIRFRREAKAKPEFVHTINGSGLATGRTLIAVLENYQEPDGSVRIPEALLPYMGGLERIAPGP